MSRFASIFMLIWLAAMVGFGIFLIFYGHGWELVLTWAFTIPVSAAVALYWWAQRSDRD